MGRILGIVGAEGAKFTAATEMRARNAIRALLEEEGVTGACSVECHLGGIDTWAHELADRLDVPFTPFPPRIRSWEGGYKQRNMQIAEHATEVICIAVRELPADYIGKRFALCYHHRDQRKDDVPAHVKSGGCWTTWYARTKYGKPTRLIVIV